MKAIVYRRHGPADVLSYEDVDKPTPADDQILIRVLAASINPLDWRLMDGGSAPLRFLLNLRAKVTIPGRDVAGVVEAVGATVTEFKPGDEVFGVCGGSFAEFACARARGLAAKPGNISFAQAACGGVAALTALQGLRDHGSVGPGRSVLVNGASGGCGTFAVQIAKAFGARVAGVTSTGNVDLVRGIGADRVFDYTREDFTASGDVYDIIFDCIDNHGLVARRGAMTDDGVCVLIGGHSMAKILMHGRIGKATSPFVRKKFVMFLARVRREDLMTIARLMSEGKVASVIEKEYELRDLPEAMRHAAAGHVRGKLVVAP